MTDNSNVWQEIYEYLDRKFPDRWDKQDDKIYIHYPEVEMTNTYGKHHTITDLYVELRQIRKEDKIVLDSSLKGMRLSASLEELGSLYKHSHLSKTRNFVAFSGFCTGRGTINNNIRECADPNLFDFFAFKRYIFALDAFVRYESSNTNPYIRFSSIGKGRIAYVKQPDADTLSSYITRIDHPEKIRFKVRKNKISILNIDSLEEAYDDILRVFNLNHLAYRDEQGNYYTTSFGNSLLNRTVQENLDRSFTFKGEDRPFQITNYEVSRDRFIHPNIKLAIKKRIEHELSYNTWLAGLINS